jgi:hypothetical protein
MTSVAQASHGQEIAIISLFSRKCSENFTTRRQQKVNLNLKYTYSAKYGKDNRTSRY